MRKLKLFSLALMALFSMGLGAQTLIEADDMETTSGSGSSLTVSGWSKGDCTISQSSEARTGSYSLKTEYNGTTDKTVKTTNTSISVPKSSYLHCVGWAKFESSDETSTSSNNQAGGNSYIGGNGKGTYVNLSKTWTQFTSKKQASSASSSAYVLLQRKHSAKKAVLFDDVVIYVSTNATTDIEAPTAATSASATASSISWTNGSDDNTGRQNTLIWRRISGSANDLTLNNQGKYATSVSDQSGHWTCVSATVAAGTDAETSSYNGTFTLGDVYAIVHRDLAYNYSTPTYVTVSANSIITGAVNEAGWGTVAPASITVNNGDEISISSNVLTCSELTLTATPTTATAEYTYAFANWSGVTNGQSVNANLTATANFTRTANSYTLAWNTNGGSDLDGTYSSGTIAYGTEIAKPNDPTLDGYEFAGWNSADDGSGTDYNGTMPAANTTYYAQWEVHVKHTDATLSALSVAGCTLNETFDPATTAYTISLPFYASMPTVSDVTATKNDPYASDPVVSIDGNVISVEVTPESGAKDKKTYTITVSIAEAPTASSSINIEQLILDNSIEYNIGAALDAANIAYVDENALDSLNDAKTARNEPYLGLKFKKNTSKFTIIVPSENYLKVKFGSISGEAGLKVSVNGSTPAAPTVTSGIYTLDASAGIKEVIFTLSANDKTVVLKQIKINEDPDVVTLPYRITFDSDGGSKVADIVVLSGEVASKPQNPTKAGLYFAGWYNGEVLYDWTAAVTANLSLKAQWSDTPTSLSNTASEIKTVKRLENGMLVIEKDGKTYNVMGARIR